MSTNKKFNYSYYKKNKHNMVKNLNKPWRKTSSKDMEKNISTNDNLKINIEDVNKNLSNEIVKNLEKTKNEEEYSNKKYQNKKYCSSPKNENKKNKYDEKTLPCDKFIRDGICPYGNKCKYIHDERLKLSSKKIINTKNKKIDNVCHNDEDITSIESINNNLENNKNKDLFYYTPQHQNNKNIYQPITNENTIFKRLDIFIQLEQGKIPIHTSDIIPMSNIPVFNLLRRGISVYQKNIDFTDLNHGNGTLLYDNLVKFIEK